MMAWRLMTLKDWIYGLCKRILGYFFSKESEENLISNDRKESKARKESEENLISKETVENLTSKESEENLMSKESEENLTSKDSEENLTTKDSKENQTRKESEEDLTSKERACKENLTSRESEENLISNDGTEDHDVICAIRPVFNVHLPSHSGTVIIGDHSTLNGIDNVSAVVGEEFRKFKEQSLLQRGRKLDHSNASTSAVPNDKVDERKGRRQKVRRRVERESLKIPSVVRKIKEIDKQLTVYRGNSQWVAHDKAIDGFHEQYVCDDDNSDIILLLEYEKAVALYEKGKIDNAEVGRSKKLVLTLIKNVFHQDTELNGELSEGRKIICSKSLLLLSKIHSLMKKFGRAEKTLEKAEGFLKQHYNDVELEAELFLAHATYQFLLNQGNSLKASGVKEAIQYTRKAEEMAANLKDCSKWEQLRREILILRCKAVIPIFKESENKDDFSEVLKQSLDVLEQECWDGILLKQKIDVLILKSDFFIAHGNKANALDYAQQALEIAQSYDFTAEMKMLNERIRKLKQFPKHPSNDWREFLSTVLNIQTTTDGNLESNAAYATDLGLFSESDEFE